MWVGGSGPLVPGPPGGPASALSSHLLPELVAGEGQDAQTTLSVPRVQIDKLSVVYFGFASLRGHIGDNAHEVPRGRGVGGS